MKFFIVFSVSQRYVERAKKSLKMHKNASSFYITQALARAKLDLESVNTYKRELIIISLIGIAATFSTLKN